LPVSSDEIAEIHLRSGLSLIGVTSGFLTLVVAFLMREPHEFSILTRVLLEITLSLIALSLFLFTLSVLHYDAGLVAGGELKKKLFARGNYTLRIALILLLLSPAFLAAIISFVTLMIISIASVLLIIILYCRGFR